MAGVNSRADLAEVHRLLNARVIRRLQEAGITVLDPATTWVEGGCDVGRDTVLEPGVHLRRGCALGERCRVGAGSVLGGVALVDGASVPPLTYRAPNRSWQAGRITVECARALSGLFGRARAAALEAVRGRHRCVRGGTQRHGSDASRPARMGTVFALDRHRWFLKRAAGRRSRRNGVGMCGIVGYIGPREGVPVVLEALRHLEYRGIRLRRTSPCTAATASRCCGRRASS